MYTLNENNSYIDLTIFLLSLHSHRTQCVQSLVTREYAGSGTIYPLANNPHVSIYSYASKMPAYPLRQLLRERGRQPAYSKYKDPALPSNQYDSYIRFDYTIVKLLSYSLFYYETFNPSHSNHDI